MARKLSTETFLARSANVNVSWMEGGNHRAKSFRHRRLAEPWTRSLAYRSGAMKFRRHFDGASDQSTNAKQKVRKAEGRNGCQARIVSVNPRPRTGTRFYWRCGIATSATASGRARSP